jgi:Spy/CpxP family protein refolding chaperone
VRRAITFAIAALALAAAPLATVSPAAADATVTVSTGGIAFGYSDGYWDQGHHWHPWHNHAQAEAWRAQHADHYYDRRHDAEKDAGWRGERWWDHR